MKRQLRVSNLPTNVTEAEVKEFFSDIGPVVSVQKAPHPKSPKGGVWIITMKHEKDAQAALSLGDDSDIKVELISE